LQREKDAGRSTEKRHPADDSEDRRRTRIRARRFDHFLQRGRRVVSDRVTCLIDQVLLDRVAVHEVACDGHNDDEEGRECEDRRERERSGERRRAIVEPSAKRSS